jgi:adenylylsulfate kinase
MVVLFYGQPASGKTTLADALIPFFPPNTVRIDGDVWRDITKNKDYSKEGRMRNLKGAFDMAILLERNGFISLMSFVTPYEELRQYLCDNSNEFIEIYLSYKGDRGRTNYFANDFEKPKIECLQIDTSENSIDECLSKVIDYIKTKTKNFNGNVE